MVNHAGLEQNLLHYSSVIVSHKQTFTPRFCLTLVPRLFFDPKRIKDPGLFSHHQHYGIPTF